MTEAKEQIKKSQSPVTMGNCFDSLHQGKTALTIENLLFDKSSNKQV
ncbi:hypothetical protein [Chryseobacterium gregarium]|nr:hypothetical protein [Chryseobacterium gregarium]